MAIFLDCSKLLLPTTIPLQHTSTPYVRNFTEENRNAEKVVNEIGSICHIFRYSEKCALQETRGYVGFLVRCLLSPPRSLSPSSSSLTTHFFPPHLLTTATAQNHPRRPPLPNPSQRTPRLNRGLFECPYLGRTTLMQVPSLSHPIPFLFPLNSRKGVPARLD